MRLPKLPAIGVMAIACATGMAQQPVTAATPQPITASTAAPTRAQVASAVAILSSDPNLASTRREKTLKFKDTPDETPKPKKDGAPWLVDLIQWIAEGSRLLMWAVGAVLVALLLVGLQRWIRIRGETAMPRAVPLPSHVQSLDIRPESLPDAIGAAAAALWQQGQQRAALSLLYRGLLSRLVHVHALPIRAASTEDECVTLAHSRLTGATAAFVARLVDMWQMAVYGARLPSSDQVLALCADFDARLNASPQRSVPA